MSEAVLILQNMRGGCATVGTTVHTLFRVNGRRPTRVVTASDKPADMIAAEPTPADAFAGAAR